MEMGVYQIKIKKPLKINTCTVCDKIINEQNVNKLCAVCLRAKRKKEKEEKKEFFKLPKSTRNVLSYLERYILNPTDQIIADQCHSWCADIKLVKANLHLKKYGRNIRPDYYVQMVYSKN